MAAHLLGTEPHGVENALLFRTITTGSGRGGRSSTYACPQDVDGARYSRDALAKALYSRMFDFIIRRVNDAMYLDDPEALIIGILDIYGFEIFGVSVICLTHDIDSFGLTSCTTEKRV